MPRSRNRPKLPLPASPARGRRPRWQWRRVFGGLAEFLRNFAFVALGAPFVEPQERQSTGCAQFWAALSALPFWHSPLSWIMSGETRWTA